MFVCNWSLAHDWSKPGPKKPFFVSTRTSCSELRTSCSGRKDKCILWSFHTMTWTLPLLRAVADQWVGAIALPPEWSLKSLFFGNQFSQFVVIFLFQGLRNSSPITNLSPHGTVNVCAIALTNQPTMTLILVSLHYVRRIQTWRNVTLRSTCMMSAGPTPKRLWTVVYFEVFTFDACQFYAFFNDLIINNKINIFLEVRSLCKYGP